MYNQSQFYILIQLRQLGGTKTKMVPIQMILQSTLKEAQHNLSKILKSSSNIQII